MVEPFMGEWGRPPATPPDAFGISNDFFDGFGAGFGGLMDSARPSVPGSSGLFGSVPRPALGFTQGWQSALSGGRGAGFGLSRPSINVPPPKMSPTGFVGSPISSGPVTPAGNAGVPQLDQANHLFDLAGQQHGVPPNVLKAIVLRESSGDWARDGSRVVSVPGRTSPILPYVGIFQETANSWGCDWNGMVGNQQAQIDCMARGLAGIQRQLGTDDWGSIALYYFSGTQDPNWSDGTMTGRQYMDSFTNDVNRMGGAGPATLGMAKNFGSPGAGNNIVQQALQYVGTPYVWGSIPGKGQDPRQTGWDCSGLTYWLDQTYGSGNLPQGSHYQYQYAVNNGLLFQGMNQLQPGDLVFLATGFAGGGGANLNPASHVGVYIGNGQMLHAANPESGTIVSSITDGWYADKLLGFMHQSFSGGMNVPAVAPYDPTRDHGPASTLARYSSYRTKHFF